MVCSNLFSSLFMCFHAFHMCLNYPDVASSRFFSYLGCYLEQEASCAAEPYRGPGLPNLLYFGATNMRSLNYGVGYEEFPL